MATLIASQAVITGSFSLTQQAIHLGFLPRVHIVHTAGEERGQIYIPIVNWGLAVRCPITLTPAGFVSRPGCRLTSGVTIPNGVHACRAPSAG